MSDRWYARDPGPQRACDAREVPGVTHRDAYPSPSPGTRRKAGTACAEENVGTPRIPGGRQGRGRVIDRRLVADVPQRLAHGPGDRRNGVPGAPTGMTPFRIAFPASRGVGGMAVADRDTPGGPPVRSAAPVDGRPHLAGSPGARVEVRRPFCSNRPRATGSLGRGVGRPPGPARRPESSPRFAGAGWVQTPESWPRRARRILNSGPLLRRQGVEAGLAGGDAVLVLNSVIGSGANSGAAAVPEGPGRPPAPPRRPEAPGPWRTENDAARTLHGGIACHPRARSALGRGRPERAPAGACHGAIRVSAWGPVVRDSRALPETLRG